jgi:hypothetical protein
MDVSVWVRGGYVTNDGRIRPFGCSCSARLRLGRRVVVALSPLDDLGLDVRRSLRLCLSPDIRQHVLRHIGSGDADLPVGQAEEHPLGGDGLAGDCFDELLHIGPFVDYAHSLHHGYRVVKTILYKNIQTWGEGQSRTMKDDMDYARC